MKKLLFTLAVCACGASAYAQQYVISGTKSEKTEGMKPAMTELYYPKVERIVPGDAATASAPSDAIVLFDGKDLSKWINSNGKEALWKINGDGTMTVNKDMKNGGGSIQTKDSFRDYQLHIEWCAPANITGSGQARGNSGVYMQGMYEIQILDNYENETYVNGQAGSLYKQSAPLVNPCRKPGEWNVYDIIYKAPTFNDNGTYRTFPLVTVIFNGVVVQNNTQLIGTTEYIGLPTVKPHGDGPILLQCHGDPSEPISFRNIWIRKL